MHTIHFFRMVDCFLVDSPVMSMSMSPTYDFLATVHLDDVGVYLWANKTLFSHVSLTALPSNYEPQVIEMPSTKRQSARKFLTCFYYIVLNGSDLIHKSFS